MRMWLVWFIVVLLCSRLLHAGDLPTSHSVNRGIVIPQVLEKIKDQNKHFDYLISHIADEPILFQYLKGRYFVLPVLKPGIMPIINPAPANALAILEKFVQTHEETIIKEISTVSTDTINSTTRQSLSKNSEQWFLLLGVLAYGKRAVNKNGANDGGDEYLKVFNYSEILAQNYTLFCALINDYCQIVRRPLRSLQEQKINNSTAIVQRFIKPFLSSNFSSDNESDLAKLYPDILTDDILFSAICDIPEPERLRQPVLSRLSKLLSDCVILNKENGVNTQKYSKPEIAIPIVEACVKDSEFSTLTENEQDKIRSACFAMLTGLGRNDEAISFQKELINKKNCGRYQLLVLYDNLIAEQKKKISDSPQENTNADTIASKYESDRMLLLANVLADFNCRREVVDIADYLYSNDMKWESFDYLTRFLDVTKDSDLIRINAAVILGRRLYQEGIMRKRYIIEKKSITAILPVNIAKSEYNTAKVQELIDADFKTDYVNRSMSVLDRINIADYEGQKAMEVVAALRELQKLQQNISKEK